MARFALLCYFSAVLLFCKVSAYSKRWIWSTNWDDPKNWDKQRVPCSQDEIQLSEGVLYIRKNMSLNSLALPTNGEIVFGEASEMTFSGGQKLPIDSNNCAASGEVVKFTGSEPKNWFNPMNWNFVENGKVAKWTDGSLYMDRIPCKTDQVSFPQGDAFVVSVKSKAEVSQIFISQRSQSDMPAYLASKAGKLRFKISGSGSLAANGRTCNQQYGCPCGYANMKETICASFECPPACENKVKPEGDCCDRCGSLIKMNLNPKFSLTSCEANLRKNLAKTDFSAATLVISPIQVGNAVERAQILLTDKTDGKTAVEAAKATVTYLQGGEDIACDVYDAKIAANNGGGGKSGKSTGGSEESSTIALAVTLSLVVVLVILAALYLLYKRKNGLLFIRRQVLHNEMEISGTKTMTVEMTDTAFSGVAYDEDIDAPGQFGASFDNPMYSDMMQQSGPAIISPQQLADSIEPVNSKPVKKEKKKSEKSIFAKAKLKSGKKAGNDAFENPVYSEHASGMKETFDGQDTFTVPDDTFVVPDDNGFQNPLYGDLYAVEDDKNVEEVTSRLPPSFLDTIGFSPDDVDEVINSTYGTAGADSHVADVADVNFGAGKGESEA